MGNLYTADLETTTDENDCRVWAWSVCDIENTDRVFFDNNIDSLIEFMKSEGNATFYFHNLKFDSDSIFIYLFEHNFKHVTRREDEETQTFTTLISDMGAFYSTKIIFEKKGKRTKYAQIYDSLKIIPFGVEQIAKAFGLPINKLELDYKSYRAPGHVLTEHEIQYITHDVKIVAMALKILFDQGLTKMTQGSNALHDYKNTVGLKNFTRWFPMPDELIDRDVRKSYRGGFTYLNPLYQEKDIGTGLVFDVNSLYPWVMHDCPLPYGEPVFFHGKYEQDDLYNLYVQCVYCQFELKPGHIPTIQLKNNLSFVPNQYLHSSNDEMVTMYLTSVDLELFLEHYDVFNLEYHGGWKFKSTTGLFSAYIDKWTKVKIDSKRTGNKGMYTLSKLMLNALYGKYGLKMDVRSKIPYYNEGKISFTYGEKEKRKPVYIPVATFVTAWARNKTIRSAQALYDLFVYADTDSLHLSVNIPDELARMTPDELEELTTADLQRFGVPIPDEFIVDPFALGAWKLESKFNRARFLRQKSYIEDWNAPETWNNPELYDPDLLNITCAGMPKNCYQFVNWGNFRVGASYSGKLLPKHVKGGIVLKDTEFTIKRA